MKAEISEDDVAYIGRLFNQSPDTNLSAEDIRILIHRTRHSEIVLIRLGELFVKRLSD